MTVRQLYSSLSRKTFMALTGLFLCVFLIVHLGGNLQLLLPRETARESFNAYSHVLSGNPLIKLVSWVLYASILSHSLDALLLTLRNRRAAGRYAVDRRDAASHWYARSMGILGSVILVFLVIHFRDFWYPYRFGALPADKWGNHDLYALVVRAYADWWYVAIYVLAMIALGYHLLHGFFSAARTLGVFHPRSAAWIRISGIVYSVVIAVGFSVIPIYLHLTQSGR